MIDFPVLYEGDIPHWVWTTSGLSYFLIFVLYYKHVVYNALWSKTHAFAKKSLFVLIFIFSVCAIYTGDFSHYQLTVKTEVGIDHLEEVYHWIIRFVNHNYLAFRILLWGGGIALLFLSFKKFKIDPYRSLFYLFASYITFYSYTRAGVAQAVYFCGFSLLFKKGNNSQVTRLLGLLLLVSSYFFHKSILVLIIFSPLCFLPINKKTLPVYLLSLIIVFVLANRLVTNVLETFAEFEAFSESIETYTKNVGKYNMGSGFVSIITYYWGQAIFHVPFWLCAISFFKYQGKRKIPNNILALFRLSFALYGFVIIMLISFGSISAFYYRFERMLIIPITVMANYLYQEKIFSRRRYSSFVLLGALLILEDFFYRIFFT